MPVTNLNLVDLLNDLKTNAQAILAAIDNDPLLTKRTCDKTGLTIANASKALFTPTETHQLFAKGLIYKKWTKTSWGTDGYSEDVVTKYELVAVPLIKQFNHGENFYVDEHVAECIAAGATPVFTDKLDGTFIMRNVVAGHGVMLSTRGMLDTMHDLSGCSVDDVDADSNGRFFEWARAVIDAKYPILRDPEFYTDSELYFELVGPGNRIVTSYSEWDLVLTGGRSQKRGNYYDRGNLAIMAKAFGLAMAEDHDTYGLSFEAQLSRCLEKLGRSDAEGTVVQFELGDQVIGRVKAKTETYRTIAALLNHCTFDHTAKMIESDLVKFGRSKWQPFKEYLINLGRKKVQEEFLELYREHHQAYWQYQAHVDNFIKGCYAYAALLKFRFNVPVMDKPSGLAKRSMYEYVKETSKGFDQELAGYFCKYVIAAVDGIIDRKLLVTTQLKTPETAATSLQVLESELQTLEQELGRLLAVEVA